jgi:peptidoglycan/xylan/chitin deacetylase (PgdA/CDA1 family)
VKGKRELLACALDSRLGLVLSRRLSRASLIGLNYHRVCDYDALDDSVISANLEEFEWQVDWLKRNVRVMSGEEIVAFVEGKLTLDGPAVCITFDDGYFDNLAAARLLAGYRLPGIFFVTTGFVGTARNTDWDRLAYAVKWAPEDHLSIPTLDGRGPWWIRLGSASREAALHRVKNIWSTFGPDRTEAFVSLVEKAAGAATGDTPYGRPTFLRWEEVAELRTLGHSVGVHTHSHVILSHVDANMQREELSRSKAIIRDTVGVDANLLAYPNGQTWSFNDDTKRVARELGFRAAFAFYGGYNVPRDCDSFELKRIHVAPSVSRALFTNRILHPALLSREP